MPDTIVTSYPEERDQVTTVRRLTLTSPAAVTTSHQEPSTRALLSALTGVRRNEQLIVQVTLGHRLPPRLVPPQPPQLDQSTVSLLLHGVQPERRPAATAALTRKLGQYGFAATLRLGVRADTPHRRRTLLEATASAIRTISGPSAQATFVPDRPARINQPTTQWSLWRRGQRLSIEELAVLTGWPLSEPATSPFPGQPPAHPKLVRPSSLARPGDRLIGTATAPGVDGELGISERESRQHVWVLGPTGTGKSTLLHSLIVQDLAAGRPLVVIEPKDLINEILAAIPHSRRRDIVVLDPLDAAPVGLNPFHDTADAADTVADHLFSVFQALYGDSLGPRSSDILRNCLRVLAGRADASLVLLPLLLTNPGFRRTATRAIIAADPIVAGPFWHWFDQLSPDAAAQVTAPLLNKIRPLLTPHLRGVLGQPQPRFNLRQVLTDHKVLLVPLQKGVIGPEAAELLGALVIAELWQALRERVTVAPRDRTTVMVYLDEVQDFLRLPTTELADALAMSRSLGASFHLAHQYIDQLSPTVRAAIAANARSRIAFQLTAADARTMSAGQSVLTPPDFTALPAHHVYASLVHHDAVQPWASAVTLPPARQTSRPATIRRLSRTQFGRPRAAIEAAFVSLLTDAPSDEGRIGGTRTRRTPS
ncbi:type IV secretion system DNA-binding domain-containing protein [Rhodococcus opacus]|uniref:type IV secretory system conjugative DNA transfer family protein n=1 Tax=Rhodococcus opacus TaxID=37919 RepID=UPI001FF3EE9D|nr:type IV secretion system DNA-binding domain-containing protein [Rhodococcus opacus]UOT06757.1 type IV secretion system DNA-binding domain-containing protein [Rhodococcus opacus]